MKLFLDSTCCQLAYLFRLLVQHIIHSMKDPSIGAFWLITLPQIVGGFEYDEDVKQKIWWDYKVLVSFLLKHCLNRLNMLKRLESMWIFSSSSNFSNKNVWVFLLTHQTPWERLLLCIDKIISTFGSLQETFSSHNHYLTWVLDFKQPWYGHMQPAFSCFLVYVTICCFCVEDKTQTAIILSFDFKLLWWSFWLWAVGFGLFDLFCIFLFCIVLW